MRFRHYSPLVGPSKMRVTPIADRTGELSIAIYIEFGGGA